ncbi:PIN domain-containing protein [Pseudactinotalea sp. Z1748]|uniref:PIN domain-containing protein n=1 Tax=Pseudactinotalea sp. Z1748 TaxID=3413027 RepID=UPI003C7A372F
MRYVDSGVVIAAFASWHEAHEVARNEVARRPGIAAHAMVEVYSVLTRLPAPHRAHPSIVARYLDAVFPEAPLMLAAPAYRDAIVRELPNSGISGGPSYDALIAATVREASGTLVTLDRRAMSTYRLLGCDAELLA